MEIILVTSIMNEEIHGTENEKKTGCGINLQKGDNVTKYRRGKHTADLKEITCERCKNAFARKMIKADKREMARLLKEEKQREKLGMADEGIVPLGGTVAKITKVDTPEKNEPEPVVPFVRNPNPKKRPEPPKQTIPGTNVAIDSSLAQFAINPNQPEQEKKPSEPEKPKPVESSVNDDFLAQFAIDPTKQSEEPKASTKEIEEKTEESIDFTAINPPLSAYEEPVENPDKNEAENPVGIIDDDDLMKMFAFGDIMKASSVQSPPVETESAYKYSTTVEEEPVYRPEPIDVDDEPDISEISENSDWDSVANQLFGAGDTVQAEEEISEEMAELNTAYTGIGEPAELSEIKSVVPDDIGLPTLDDITFSNQPPKYEKPEVSTPILDDIGLPVLDEIAPVQKSSRAELPEITAPLLDDIQIPLSTPAIEEKAEESPEINSIGLPSLDDIMRLQEELENEISEEETATEESFDEEESINEEATDEEEYEEPEEYDEYVEEESEEEEISEEETSEETEEVYEEEPIMQQPVSSAPQQQPYIPQQPTMQQPMMQQPMMQQPMMQIGQVVSVPQYSGLDPSGQPIYMYVQMQVTGYNEHGQPIYIPFTQPAMQQQYMMPQQTQPTQPSTQPQQRVSRVPKKPPVPPRPENEPLTPGQKIAAAAAANGGMPANASNISKISVHEHSRSTSQAFINAIAESKEYANKSLTETQGMQSRMPVLNSIEDILSSMGDNSEKEKRQRQEAMKKNVPVYEEYKTPSAPVRPSSSVQQKKSAEPARPLSKAELKEKKKQEKIDAKFRKDLAKKGF
ncbi:MAG: hypothetical protein K2J08_06800 [Ruminococcus sp.]|nr:hypothetical protein [Ruminococcus sp.]